LREFQTAAQGAKQARGLKRIKTPMSSLASLSSMPGLFDVLLQVPRSKSFQEEEETNWHRTKKKKKKKKKKEL